MKAIDLAADAGNDPLLRMLEDLVREGKVGMFGVGSDWEVVPELIAERPEYCAVVQYEWSILNPLIQDDFEVADSSSRSEPALPCIGGCVEGRS